MEIVLSLFLAAKDPYNWEMDCSRWQVRALEILEDKKLRPTDRRFLIRYLRSKVRGECPFDWDLVD